jgi:hypothetical protein
VGEIRERQSEPRFNAFVSTFGDEFRQLELQYKALLQQSRLYFDFVREAAGDETRLLNKFSLGLKEECTTLADTLWVSLLHYVSRAILDGRFLRKSRVKQARSLGFELTDVVSQLTFNELVLIFCTILSGLLVTFGFFEVAAGNARPVDAIVKSLMISIIYCTSVFFAIFPKKWWPFGQCPRPAKLRSRPWAFYLAVASISAGVSLLISAVFRLALTAGDWGAVIRNLMEKYPYCLVAFTMAFLISLCADNSPARWLNRHWLRAIETVSIGGAGFGLAFLVHRWLNSTIVDPAAVPPLAALAGVFGFMGAFLGCCVPTWYREASRPEVPFEELRAIMGQESQPVTPGFVPII